MPKRWESAEEHVRHALERKFGMPFPKRVISFGRFMKEFDAVSANGEFVAMVKAWLARASARRKFLILIERDYADWFRPIGKFLFPGVEIICVQELIPPDNSLL